MILTNEIGIAFYLVFFFTYPKMVCCMSSGHYSRKICRKKNCSVFSAQQQFRTPYNHNTFYLKLCQSVLLAQHKKRNFSFQSHFFYMREERKWIKHSFFHWEIRRYKWKFIYEITNSCYLPDEILWWFLLLLYNHIEIHPKIGTCCRNSICFYLGTQARQNQQVLS